MKTMGKVRITTEALAKLLELPDDVVIKTMTYDATRENLDVVVQSHEPVSGLTYKISESQEAPVARIVNTQSIN